MGTTPRDPEEVTVAGAPALAEIPPATRMGAVFGELPDPAHEPFDRLPAGTTMGHVHLCVADPPASTT
jgi:hypothetical protein